MLKRLTLLVVLLVIAKPVYDFAKPYADQILQSEGIATILEQAPALIEQVPEIINSSQSPVTAEVENNSVQPVDVVLEKEPGTVSSYEDLVAAAFYYTERYETAFQITYKGSTSNLEQMLNDIYDELKEQNPYLYYHLMKRNIEYTYSSRKATIQFQHEYLTNYEQERYVNGKVQAIVKSIPSSLSDYEKVKYVNDWIVQNTQYGENSSSSPHSAYAVAMEGVGVCQGYALLAMKLLNELDISVMYIVGDVESGPHAWNLVQLDGQWYHMDVTWNDPVPDRGSKVRYDYFLKSDTHMNYDHTWIATDYPAAPKNY